MAEMHHDFTVMDLASALGTLRLSWQAVWSQLPDPCFFFNPLYIEAASRADVPDAPTHIIAGYDAAQLVFVLPIRFKRIRPLCNFFFVGSPQSQGWDHLAPLDISNGKSATSEFLGSYLGREKNTVFVGDNLADEFFRMAMAQTLQSGHRFVRASFRCPVKVLAGSLTAVEDTLSRTFRRNIRCARKRINAMNVQFRVIDDTVSREKRIRALEHLMEMHRQRSDAAGRKSKFLESPSRQIHRHLIEHSDQLPGSICLFELRVDSDPIAIIYGFRTPVRYWGFQSGFRIDHAKSSPLTILDLHAMDFLRKLGVEYFDFLRGMDSYKLRWTSEVSENWLMMEARSVRGRLGLEYARIQRAQERYGRKAGLLRRLRNRD